MLAWKVTCCCEFVSVCLLSWWGCLYVAVLVEYGIWPLAKLLQHYWLECRYFWNILWNGSNVRVFCIPINKMLSVAMLKKKRRQKKRTNSFVQFVILMFSVLNLMSASPVSIYASASTPLKMKNTTLLQEVVESKRVLHVKKLLPHYWIRNHQDIFRNHLCATIFVSVMKIQGVCEEFSGI